MLHPNNSKENKRKNRNNVLKMLLLYAPISRVELAKRTGLSKMTLTNIVNEFLAEGIVCEQEKDTAAPSGRKPIFLSIAPRSLCACAIYLSRRAVSACLLTPGGELLFRRSLPLSAEETGQTLMEKLNALARFILENGRGFQIAGIGVGAIGPVDARKGVLLNPPAFYGIHNLPVTKLLWQETGLPAFLDNDMNAAALSEKYFGSCKELKDFIYIGVTDGIGAGIVSGGRLLMGNGGFTGEIGHTTVDIDGRPCPCGSRGCLELYADAKSTAAYYAARRGLTSLPAYNDIAARALAGEKEAQDAIKRQSRYLGVAVTNLANLFDPDSIIFGHDISAAGSFATQEIAKESVPKMLSAPYRVTPVHMSAFGADAPLVGAGALVFHRILE